MTASATQLGWGGQHEPSDVHASFRADHIWIYGGAWPAHYHVAMIPETAPIFRVAAQADVAAVVALVESAYRGDSGRRGWTTESDLLDGRRTDTELVAELLLSADSAVLLAVIDDALWACCHIERHGDSAYFGMFAVDPSRQGSGLGRQVLAEAERFARETWHCRAMHMKVIDVRSELMAWYERRGYRRTGEYSAFPYGDERFGIPLRDDLRFELMIKDLLGVTP